MKRREAVIATIKTIVLALISLAFLLPLIWMDLTASG